MNGTIALILMLTGLMGVGALLPTYRRARLHGVVMGVTLLANAVGTDGKWTFIKATPR